jgi:hypothetical protein
MPEQEQLPAENGNFKPLDFDSLGKQDRLATVRWYLIATGIFALALAIVCLIMDATGSRDFFSHRDFALNPRALSRYLLYVGLILYAAGRSITYYQRFAKRKSG